jgi:hypothetical protein
LPVEISFSNFILDSCGFSLVLEQHDLLVTMGVFIISDELDSILLKILRLEVVAPIPKAAIKINESKVFFIIY